MKVIVNEIGVSQETLFVYFGGAVKIKECLLAHLFLFFFIRTIPVYLDEQHKSFYVVLFD